MLEGPFSCDLKKPRGSGLPTGWGHRASYSILSYTFVRAFLASHDRMDVESETSDLVRWIRTNRAFFTRVTVLESNAKSLWHPVLTYRYPTQVWIRRYYTDASLDKSRAHFEEVARTNMRLMCLDAGPECRIGWAAPGARLLDEMFLIPGCNRPVVLRRRGERKYQLIRDAIAIGAIKGEVWKKASANRVQRIEII
jgi:hypothetical protein